MHLSIHGLPQSHSTIFGGTGISIRDQVAIADFLRDKPSAQSSKASSLQKYVLIQRVAVRIMTISATPCCYNLEENDFFQIVDDKFWNRLVWSREDLAAFQRISHICFTESRPQEQLVITPEDPFLKLNEIRKDDPHNGLSRSKIFEWRFELCRIATLTDTIITQTRKVRNRVLYLICKQYCFGSQITNSLQQRGSKKLNSQERGEKRQEWERCRRILKWDETLLLCWQIELQRWETRRTYLESAIDELSKLSRHEKFMKYSLNFVLESSHFPKLIALCTLISALEPRRKRLIQKPPNKPTFDSLPHEVRFLIWKYAAPGPRVIFQHPENNKSLPLLSVCRESRAIAKTQYTPLHLPSPKLAHSPSKYFAFLYVDLNKDTVVRDLSENMNPSPETALLTWELHSLFYESGSAFRSSCVRHFWGLARVKSLTIPFNMEEDMRRIFGSLVYCCPNLEVLNLVPTSQLRPQKRQYPLPEGCERAKLIPVDGQLIDYVDYRLVRITNRKIRRNKASRAADKLAKLFSASKELRDVELPKFIKERMCGGYWNPTLQVCLVAMWRACPGQKEESHGWYSRYLSGDYYTKGYTGDDGEFHHGFLECLNLMGEDDIFLDQYKGMASIFE